MDKNPDPIVESYQFVLDLPLRASFTAGLTTYHVRENARRQAFTVPTVVMPYYVSEGEGGGFLTEAATLHEARKLLVRKVVEVIGRQAENFAVLLNTLAQLTRWGEENPIQALQHYKTEKAHDHKSDG